MKLTCTVDFQPEKIRANLGLGKSGRAQRYLAQRAKAYLAPYVPYDTGYLKNTAQVANGGRWVVYTAPYARAQYYLPYRHRDPRRGRLWDRRMAAAQGQALARELGAYLGGEKP